MRQEDQSHTGAVIGLACRYFAWVFAAGFLMGLVRVPLLLPRLGERWAELIEMPFMLAVIVLSARHLLKNSSRSLSYPLSRRGWLMVGLLALGLMLSVEFGVVLSLRRISLETYLAMRDPVAGTVYIALLGVFALLPWWLSGRQLNERAPLS